MNEQAQRRVHLRIADNDQTVRTRLQLVTAYSSAAEQAIPRVSVRWLCQKAGVARSTFYTHFSSVEDLAAFVVTADFEQLAVEDTARRAGGETGAAAARSGLSQVVQMLSDRRILLEYAFGQASRPIVVDRMMEWFATYTWEIVATVYADVESQVPLIVDFTSAGVVHTVLGWLSADGPVDEKEIVEVLVALLPERLR